MAKRGRRKRVESGGDDGGARDTGRQRMVYRSGNSWVVAVPQWVRAAVDRPEGGLVYWHDVRAHEAVLSNAPRRRAGHPHGSAMQRTIDQLRRQVRQLQEQLAQRPLAVLHEGKAVGWAEASKYYLTISADLEVIRNEVRELAARMPFGRRSKGRRVVTVPAPVLGRDDDPSPSASPSLVEQGSPASGAASPQAAHV